METVQDIMPVILMSTAWRNVYSFYFNFVFDFTQSVCLQLRSLWMQEQIDVSGNMIKSWKQAGITDEQKH